MFPAESLPGGVPKHMCSSTQFITHFSLRRAICVQQFRLFFWKQNLTHLPLFCLAVMPVLFSPIYASFEPQVPMKNQDHAIRLGTGKLFQLSMGDDQRLMQEHVSALDTASPGSYTYVRQLLYSATRGACLRLCFAGT